MSLSARTSLSGLAEGVVVGEAGMGAAEAGAPSRR